MYIYICIIFFQSFLTNKKLLYYIDTFSTGFLKVDDIWKVKKILCHHLKSSFFRQQTAVQLYSWSLLIPHTTIFTLLNMPPYQYPPSPQKNHTIEFRASRKVKNTSILRLKMKREPYYSLKNNQILVVHVYIKKSDVFDVIFAHKMQSRGL